MSVLPNQTQITFGKIGEHRGLLPFADGESTPGFSLFLLSVEQSKVDLSESQNHFGFVSSGSVTLCVSGRSYPLVAGMYFSVAGPATIEGSGTGIIVSQSDYRGLFQVGGPIESTGRLHYIDGCSDTLLISPVRKGESCLNFLCLPPRTNQTSHTHPSFRFGVIVEGQGFCDCEQRSEPLFPGKAFFIPAEGRHRFRTETETLSVIAFHPDSDFGPHDDDHPMVNKTIVDGIPASKLTHRERGIEK